VNASASPPEPARDVFDDILARIEALRASTIARIAELDVALDGGHVEDPGPGEPPADVLLDLPEVATLEPPPAPVDARVPIVVPLREDMPEPVPSPPTPPGERRIVVIDDLSAEAPSARITVRSASPPRITLPTIRIPRITLPTIRIPRITLPTIRIPRITVPTIRIPRITLPTTSVPLPVLSVAGGVVVLFAVAGLVPTPEVEPAAEAPVVIEFALDGSAAVAPVVPPPTPQVEPAEVIPAVPLLVRIPAISVDAVTVPVGLEVDGSMEIPSDVATIGWYEPADGLGVRPGQTGTAVLAGHVDSRTQGAGAFYSLRDLAVGDRIEVVHEDGTTSTWRITKVTQYRKDELPIEEVFVWSGPPRLALITCGGAFDWTARSYTDNLVVYAEPDVAPLPDT
jgi:hypothetical protein